MKVLYILGDSASGKMTVGQELCKLTDFKLLHNHMLIEPVLELYGYYDKNLVWQLRKDVLEHFSKRDEYGLIMTFQFAFNKKEEWDYLDRINEIFNRNCSEVEFYYVELDCDIEERLRRNRTDNRLEHKASKRDVEASEERILRDNIEDRFQSIPEDNIPWENFIAIENTFVSAERAAHIIKDTFKF